MMETEDMQWKYNTNHDGTVDVQWEYTTTMMGIENIHNQSMMGI